MKRLIPAAFLTALAGGGWSVFNGVTPADLQKVVAEVASGAPSAVSPLPSLPEDSAPPLAPRTRTDGPSIRIATFNIKDFGDSKAKKPHVMDAIARVIRQFDVVALQEISTQDDNYIPRFLDQHVNRYAASGGDFYDARVSPRLGRGTATEQYAFVFNTTTIEIHPTFQAVVPDDGDRLARDAYAALFRTRVREPYTPFTFILINVHTDPDEVPAELDALYEVYVRVQRTPIGGATEDDVILLGDFNTRVPAASPYTPDASSRPLAPTDLGRLAEIPHLSPLIRNQATNVAGTRLYDNILISAYMTREYIDRGVFDLRRDLGFQQVLTRKQVEQISDHLPVWGEFSAIEVPAYRAASR